MSSLSSSFGILASPVFQLRALLYPISSYDVLLRRFFQAQHSLQGLKRLQLLVLKVLVIAFSVYLVATIEEEILLDRTMTPHRNPQIHPSFLDEIGFFVP